MKNWIMSAILATALTGTLAAEDKDKFKEKASGVDPVTGEKVKTRTKAKVESDGDYKEKTTTHVNGHKTKTKVKRDVDNDGDVKEKVKVKGSDGKYESKTKIDR